MRVSASRSEKVLGVAHDADDLDLGNAAEGKVPPERVGRSEEIPRHRLVHDRDRRRGRAVGRADIPARHETHADGVEEPRPDQIPLCRRVA